MALSVTQTLRVSGISPKSGASTAVRSHTTIKLPPLGLFYRQRKILRCPPAGLPLPCSKAAACMASVSVGEEERTGVKESKAGKGTGVPVYVMLPLDTVRPGGGGLNRKKAMKASLTALRTAGVDGIMVDVWWGLVERERPREYNWSGYDELVEMARAIGLKVQVVMSFHQCGGNVGDTCTIPLPRWVVEEIDRDQDLAFTDRWGRRNYEYVSLGCDTLTVLKGRTPIQCYGDFMRAFRDRFSEDLGTTIVEIQVGLGPAGELRYPSYPELHGTWKFPGIGAFQCYDKYMLGSLKAAAEVIGRPEWGHGGPSDAGGYNNWPEDTAFFRQDGGWLTNYGDFFLSWYSQMLIDHGDRVLSAAASVFQDCTNGRGLKLSAKVSGVHWHYGTRSHAAELTAGYFNTREREGYLPIAKMIARHGAVLNFTCVEMKDREQPWEAQCRPEALVRQVAEAARKTGVEMAGENALPRYDDGAYDQIVRTAMAGGEGAGKSGRMCGFTYLRMGAALFHPENWSRFARFVRKMKKGEGRWCLEEVEKEAAPMVREAVVSF